MQVRAKELTSRGLLALVRGVIAEAGGGERILINSRPDLAELTGAAGVHLPESGLDPRSVRRSFPGLLIGVSRHDRSGLERARDEGADFAIVGPVYPTPGKEDRELGEARLRDMLLGAALPVLVVGGITPSNAPRLRGIGARGVAAIRPFALSEAASSASAFRAALDGGIGA